MAPASDALHLKYRYKQVPLPGGGFDWVAVLPVQLSKGSTTTSPFEALIDSGARTASFIRILQQPLESMTSDLVDALQRGEL
jgi:hypothetical protein